MVAKSVGISVVVPCYMKARQVQRCVNSLLASRGLGKNFSLEIVVVDDSPDSSVQNEIKSLSAIAPKGVTYKYNKPKRNAGIAESRNIGVSLSKNEIVIALDSDILAESDAVLEILNTFMRVRTASMVMGNIYWKGGAMEGKLDRPRKHDRRIRIDGVEYLEMTHGRCIAFRRSAFLEAGGYDSVLFPMQGEGPDLSIRFWRAGHPIVYNPKIRVYHISGFMGKQKPTSPYLYHRWDGERTALMFRSIVLYFYKYGQLDADKSNWMKTIALESDKNFGKKTGYLILSSLAGELHWIANNGSKIEDSRKKVPNKYNFKPYDVFTDRKLLLECIKAAGK
ncbi:MAG: glycosyltransferase [Candidatus Aenigmatarchaeota archaeon]|nr:MAG: glycosyltransferase [Candidatus Aenigmarchaeota archaeon]